MSLDQLIQLNIRLDQHRRNKGWSTWERDSWRLTTHGNRESVQPEPELMDIGDQKATTSECKKTKMLGQCWGCGKKGHWVASCSRLVNKSRKASLVLDSVSPSVKARFEMEAFVHNNRFGVGWKLHVPTLGEETASLHSGASLRQASNSETICRVENPAFSAQGGPGS